MNAKDLFPTPKRRKVRLAREAEALARDIRSAAMIQRLQDRKINAEGFLIPRQRRNHWQEAITRMIDSGKA